MEQKRQYILRYQDWEEIRLNISHIAKNPGHKATANLFHVVIPPLLMVSFLQFLG